jgi:phage terminase large subunit
MTQAASERLALLKATVLDNPWIPHTPAISPVSGRSPQAAFLTDPRPEVMYGGAAGGGKSDAMLMAAAQYVRDPGYNALILRRTYPQLSQAGGLIPRSLEWWSNSGARWNGTDKTWTFPSGATIAFGHLQHENTKYDYQSGEYAFIGFEELTQFSLTQYLYLFSRRRRLCDAGFPVRVRSTTNPGGIGHAWVKARFIDSIDPERGFIPALLEDNPYLDVDEYAAALENLDPVTREQLRRGDWQVSLNNERIFPNVQVRAITEEERANMPTRLHGVDWGYFPDPWQYVRIYYDAARRTLYVLRDVRALRQGNEATARLVLAELGQEWDAAGKVSKQARRELIMCDSAEPKSIADYRAAGLDARPVPKGPGSVDYGIKWLQSLAAIVIDGNTAPNAAREFTGYEYELGRDGEYVDAYPDADNHTIDAVRYAAGPVIARRNARG